MTGTDDRVANAMTIDLEDWPQSVLGSQMPITTRVLRNTDRMLNLLDRYGVRATFFALGKVCERFPRLLPQIASAEVGCVPDAPRWVFDPIEWCVLRRTLHGWTGDFAPAFSSVIP